MKRIAFLHTVAALAEKFRALAGLALPDTEAFHMLDESLLQDLMRQRSVEGRARTRLPRGGAARGGGWAGAARSPGGCCCPMALSCSSMPPCSSLPVCT